ncbi:trimeric intracellular cation channel family protein [Sulfurimonas marina]|uniref:Trimeric intracellular cation channel family protein n=1 Tax=Sulfurimonas marina TaxID=2590551 RepID=A0A7M1AWG4_9BACT|nr:TRIC cation channel family protein [Sulfurimonas marina]QOP41803.1 trimeric intracellular cation channel family protein [Sulfurimonas marina]
MFEISEYIGIIAFAMSGFFVGVKNRLDLLGILISTFLTALGGGVIRDVIVDRPPFTFTHTYPALTILLVMLGLIIFQYHKRNSIENKPLFILSDSIGLVSFSISGAIIGLEADFNLTGVIATSFITAVGGGIARDVIINEIPFVLKTGFYGTIAILIALSVYLLEMFSLLNLVTTTALFFLFLTLRLVAFYKKWSIPLI